MVGPVIGAGASASASGDGLIDGWAPTDAAQLREDAKALSARGVQGVELGARIEAEAIRYYAQLPNLTPQQRYDGVMRDVTAVLVGPRIIGALELLARQPGLNTPLLQQFLAEFKRMDLGNTLAMGQGGTPIGPDIDPSPSSDYRASLRAVAPEDPRNKVLHVFSFALMSYVTNNTWLLAGGNFKHELLDPPTSTQDYDLGLWGIDIGLRYRKLRDTPSSGDRGLHSLPVLWGAGLSKDGATFGASSQEWNDGFDYTALAQDRDQAAREHPNNPSGNLIDGAINDLCDGSIQASLVLRKNPTVDNFLTWLGRKLGVA